MTTSCGSGGSHQTLRKKNPRKMVQQWTEQPGGFVEHSDLKGLKTWLRKTTVHIIYSHFVGDTQKAVSRGPF